MTDREAQIVRFIDGYWHECWSSPSVREIAAHCGLSSPSTVYVHLEKLVRRGVLERTRLSDRRVPYRRAWHDPQPAGWEAVAA